MIITGIWEFVALVAWCAVVTWWLSRETFRDWRKHPKDYQGNDGPYH